MLLSLSSPVLPACGSFHLTCHHSIPFTSSLGLQLHHHLLKKSSLTSSLREGPPPVFPKGFVLPPGSIFHISWWRSVYYRLWEGHLDLSLTHYSNKHFILVLLPPWHPTNVCWINNGMNDWENINQWKLDVQILNISIKQVKQKIIRLWQVLSRKTWRNE